MELRNEDIEYKSKNQDFDEKTRTKLLLRASLRCSNPNCRRLTAAFSESSNKVVCIGEAAHIRAKSPGGPRFEKNYDATQIENGIWLCPSCHTLIDKNGVSEKYSIALLEEWKHKAETSALPLLEDAKTDMLLYFGDLGFPKSSFDFTLASDWQILLVLYGLFNDKNVKVCNNYLDGCDDDYFMDFYNDFYNWFMGHKKIRKAFPNVRLDPPISLSKTIYGNKSVCIQLSVAINDNNLMDFVRYKNNYSVLDVNALCDYLFGDDEEKADNFFKFWQD